NGLHLHDRRAAPGPGGRDRAAALRGGRPGEEVVTDLIVEQGRLLRRSIVVPVGWVQHADERGILLNARLADLEELPTYREVEFEEPDPAKRRVAGYDSGDVRFWLTPYGPIGPRRPHLARRVRLGVP